MNKLIPNGDRLNFSVCRSRVRQEKFGSNIELSREQVDFE